MTKQLFIESIEAIKNQCILDNGISKHLSKAFPNAFAANLLSDNHFILDALVKILKVEMNDIENDWIEYFIWELDFGKKNNKLKITEAGKEIPMSNASQLYDFLINIK